MDDLKPQKGTTAVVLQWLGIFFLAAIAIAILAYVFGWITAPLTNTSSDKVRALARDANEHYASLESSLANITVVERQMSTMVELYGENSETWPQGKADEYLQLATQRANLVTAYNRLCASYKAKWNNEWYDLPAPDDLPKTCEVIN